ncbi:hypothetical protein EJ03DRAFT_318687 [Teratosphaeria nubilosa]|uniref:Uncharacterized protein n=1 Tax=Teratosphaeria nubilosa TaxID=161662 RepID=A0A6G1KZ19_9PEZI|nr:hypothetical protein EJ03DRAFT_318687 [Teratosphaeria nubilosa]
MAPPRPALAQSESKARFFERLGLREDNEMHRRVYAMMKEEAVEGRRRLTEDQNALLSELRHTNIEPPYSHAHVTETAIHREIMRIYHLARPLTRQVYDLGRDTERVEEENWVIRWMLWHVFRYRDNRNRNRRGTSSGNSGDADDDNMEDMRSSKSSGSGRPTSRYWDPVRHG